VDFFLKKVISLRLPASTNVTRKIIGWRDNLAWLLIKPDDSGSSILRLLEEWLQNRVMTLNKEKETETKLLNELTLRSIEFWETLIELTLRITEPLALMVKLCQSKSSAGHLIHSFYTSMSNYFKHISNPEDLAKIDPSIRETYQQLVNGRGKISCFKNIKLLII
jgi:hypothetical protein